MIYDLAKEQLIKVLSSCNGSLKKKKKVIQKKVINNCSAVNTKDLAKRASNMVLQSEKLENMQTSIRNPYSVVNKLT